MAVRVRNRQDTAFVLALCAVFGALLYALTWDLRPYPFLGWVDDYRYVKSAWYLRQFEWLGPFDATTLIKRPFFPFILAVTSSLGLPFDPFQVFLYMFGVAFFVHSLLRLGIRRWIAGALFAVLAIIPTIYDSDGSRVFRETITVGLEFVILGLALRLLLIAPQSKLRDLLWGPKSVLVYSIFALAAFHWGMREEGILLSLVLVPLLCAVGMWRLKGEVFQRALGSLILCAGIFVFIGAANLAIRSANYFAYGVFLVNDLSDGEFPRVVGVLKSIEEGPPSELLLHPFETDKLVRSSPRFRQIGEVLQKVQLNHPETDYSHEMFFLRVTALQGTELGASALNTQRYFRELYEELSNLCNDGTLKCEANPRLSVVPRYSRLQWKLAAQSVARLGEWTVRTRNSGFDFLSQRFIGVEPVPNEVLKQFVEITRQQPFGWDGHNTEYTLPGSLPAVLHQQQRRQSMGDFYSKWSPFLYLAAALALPVFVLLVWRARQYEWFIVFGVLTAHASARILAFSYLSAIDEGVPVRLIKPAYPFALASAVIVLGIVVTLLSQRRPSPSSRS